MLVIQRVSLMDSKISSILAQVKQHVQAGMVPQAITLLQKALIASPHDAALLEALGHCYIKTLEYPKAIECFTTALAITPDSIVSLVQIIQMHLQLLNYDVCEKYLQQLEKLAPQNFFLATFYRKFAAATCAWDKATHYGKLLDQHNQQMLDTPNGTVEKPLSLCTRSMDKAYLLATAKYTAKQDYGALSKLAFSPPPKLTKKTIYHIGYVSDDIADHPVGHLIHQVFQYHDRSKFKVTLYHYNQQKDYACFREAVAGCDVATDIANMTAYDAAKKIHADEVDILIDLKGHTANNRLAVFAYRPAPIQMTYLGFPGTTGCDFIDYMIADNIVIPPDHQPFYSEKILYLPHCYQPNPITRTVANTTVTRAMCGLPENAFVFGSFNWSYKVEKILFDRWCTILQAVPQSVLWLLATNQAMQNNIRAYLQNKGIALERVIFAPAANKPDHLARLQLTDLILDTYTCNGHTTTSDALAVGVPVLTCQGQHFASRVASSILINGGFPDLVSYSLDEYQAKAIHYAEHPELILKLKQQIAGQSTRDRIFNPRQHCQALEDLLLTTLQK
jgi:protein O-GlcNAc transferase